MSFHGRFLKNALECVTQCILLPGVELNFEHVMLYYRKNIRLMMIQRKKRDI